jgi:ribose/xylose/arabinose/galactoside ABC-type transport system permease subunit
MRDEAFKRGSFLKRNLTIIAPAAVFIVFFIVGGLLFRNFFTLRVLLNLLTNNAFLGLAAVGMTVVIISGGIDLSVGAVISTTAMVIAILDRAGIGPLPAILLAMLFATGLGALMGLVIQYFDAPPFIVTLAGMFFARGLGYILSLSSIPINGAFYHAMSTAGVRFEGGAKLTVPAMIFLFMVLVTWFLLRHTKFGRTCYAMGGNEQSAFLMGLPVPRTKVLIYTFSGLCSGIGGLVYVFYTLSGYGLAAIGLELQAIAAVVIGGTLLTGGFGSVLGTLIGVGIRGTIQTFITFQGTLNVYWTPIFVGLLLFLFILLQKAFLAGTRRGIKGK